MHRIPTAVTETGSYWGCAVRSVVILRWGTPFPGREAESLRFAADGEELFREKVKDGTIARYEWLTSVTGEDDDMLVLWGDSATLSAMMASPEMALLQAHGRYLLRDFRWDLGLASDQAAEVYGAWGQMLAEHATA